MGMSWEDTIDKVKGVGPKKAQALKKLGISTLYDLLTYYPRAYIDQSHRTPFAELRAGETATVSGVITNLNERRGSRRGMTILTSCPILVSCMESALTMSARPPVFANGTTSAETIKIFIYFLLCYFFRGHSFIAFMKACLELSMLCSLAQ